MYHPFSVAETIKTAWNIFKGNFITIIVYSIITFVLIDLLKYANEIFNFNHDFNTTVALFVVGMFIQTYTTLGLYKLTFTLIDSQYYEFNISQVLPRLKMIVSFISIGLLTAFVVVNITILINYLFKSNELLLALAEFIGAVGSIYLAVRFLFCICFIVDDLSGPLEALKQSFVLTRGHNLKIILIVLISIVLIAVGYLIPQSLGMIFTYPLVNLIFIEAYRKLVYSHQDVDDDVAETL
jgi:hypothetical protein